MSKILSVPLLLLTLVQGCATAPTFEQEFNESFNQSFDATCQGRLEEWALRYYSKVSSIAIEHVSAEIRDKVKEHAVPLFTACTCAREKLDTKVNEKSSTHMQISMDATVLFNDTLLGCAPSSETGTRVKQGLLSLVLATPAPVHLLSHKREAFSLTAPVSYLNETTTNVKPSTPSLFASYDRPPKSLPRLVFLAPGTAKACDVEDICIDPAPLKISYAGELLATQSGLLGKDAGVNLKRVIDQFGDQAQVITSDRNYSNFTPSQIPAVVPSQASDAFVYSVARIDGQSIERTRVRRVWLVLFHSLKAYSVSDDFVPALTTVHELEFIDTK